MGCGNETTVQAQAGSGTTNPAKKASGPMHTLTYFPVYGRTENIRAMLWKAKIDFTDKRLPFAEWPAVKATLPVKGLPFMKLSDGTVLYQSNAI